MQHLHTLSIVTSSEMNKTAGYQLNFKNLDTTETRIIFAIARNIAECTTLKRVISQQLQARDFRYFITPYTA